MSDGYSDSIDLIEQAQAELQAMDFDEEAAGMDRRQFVFLSLVAATATTLGAANVARAQGRGGAGGAGGAQQAAPPPIPLGNAEPPAEQFMPYPGGTGALMQKLIKERGTAAFERSKFKVDSWKGPMPASDDDIAFLPTHRQAALIQSKKLTSTRLTKIYLDRLKRLNPILLCAVTIMEERGLREAAAADAEIAAGKYRGPLHGIPYGIKDLFATKGAPTTWGSQDFENRVIDEDAEVVVRLNNAGAVLIAKLSTGLYAQNDQWFRGRTNDPWNLSRGSSGSSAGPASATAAGCVSFALGTETSGSIVSPANACGNSALRPTFGRVSRTGGMVLSWAQDRVGPFGRTIEDCALVFNTIHGVDEKDPSTVTTPFQFDPNIKLSSLRIGVDSGRPGDPANNNRGFDAGIPAEFKAKLLELGMKPVEIGARPSTAIMGGGGLNAEYAAAFDEIVQRKAKEIGVDIATLETQSGQRGGGGGGGGGAGGGRGGAATPIPGSSTPNNPAAGVADWNPRFVVGRTQRALDFLQAQRRRYILITQWGEFMKDLDMFIGSNADVGTNAQTGHPCCVVPYKFDVPGGGGAGGRGGAPAGGAPATPVPPLNPQPICAVIVGNLYNDDKILSAAHAFQKVTDFHTHKPVL